LGRVAMPLISPLMPLPPVCELSAYMTTDDPEKYFHLSAAVELVALATFVISR